jgi:hypothetical protein
MTGPGGTTDNGGSGGAAVAGTSGIDGGTGGDLSSDPARLSKGCGCRYVGGAGDNQGWLALLAGCFWLTQRRRLHSSLISSRCGINS